MEIHGYPWIPMRIVDIRVYSSLDIHEQHQPQQAHPTGVEGGTSSQLVGVVISNALVAPRRVRTAISSASAFPKQAGWSTHAARCARLRGVLGLPFCDICCARQARAVIAIAFAAQRQARVAIFCGSWQARRLLREPCS